MRAAIAGAIAEWLRMCKLASREGSDFETRKRDSERQGSDLAVTHNESRIRRRQIVADIDAVARKFGVSVKYVHECCYVYLPHMTQEERRRRREEIADAMRAPDADIDAVARKFAVKVGYVYGCCREHEVPLLGHGSKPGSRPVNVFAVLKDLLAGETQEECSTKYNVSRARISQIAMLAREGGWTELRRPGQKKRAR
jgi:hypothetical protein